MLNAYDARRDHKRPTTLAESESLIKFLEWFQKIAASEGLPANLIDDGAIHPFYAPGDKPGTLNAWYFVSFNTGAFAGFGNWNTETAYVAYEDRTKITAYVRQRVRQNLKAARLVAAVLKAASSSL